MSRERDDRRRIHSKFVTFKGCAKSNELTDDLFEVRTHIRNVTLVNKVRSNPAEGEPDWYDFTVIVGSISYSVDEKTYRRLLSCLSVYNS